MTLTVNGVSSPYELLGQVFECGVGVGRAQAAVMQGLFMASGLASFLCDNVTALSNQGFTGQLAVWKF